MKFKVVSHESECIDNDTVYLIIDGWDDWFTYSTLFKVCYVDFDDTKHRISSVKIGQKGQGRSPMLPKNFEKLNDDFFSLGSSENYYQSLKDISPDGNLMEEILVGLNDMAFNLDIFEKVKRIDVVRTSLMRDITSNEIKNQYHSIATGGAWLTKYSFSYIPYPYEHEEEHVELEFDVELDQILPTNIHVLIGKNGVGKTTILKNMVYSLQNEDENKGRIEMYGRRKFANIVYVSFSAFDKYVKIEDERIPYFNIGIVKEDGIKGFDEFSKDFAESPFEISSGIGRKRMLWNKTISILESWIYVEKLICSYI